MTYMEYRDSFTSVEEFKKAFGKLSRDEAYALISTINGSAAIKASAVTVWENARKELEEAEEPSHSE